MKSLEKVLYLARLLNLIKKESMKKLLVMFMLTLFSMGAFAQTEQGQSAFGFNLGYNFNDIGNASLGIDYRYCLTDEVRLTPSFSHLIKNDGLSAWAIDMNAHYIFKLSEMCSFYPLAGLSLSFWKADLGGFSDILGTDLGSAKETYFGVNLGLGGEIYATDQITVGLEAKYNIIKDFDGAAVAVRVGYSF